ncbi:hypothetical protein KCU81_g3835, partial [Aureobasidium melanogenum]
MPNPALQKPPTFTLGKSLIALVNLVTLFGPYLADWNKTHIYNPNWPPHARYHNGQTMSLGLFPPLTPTHPPDPPPPPNFNKST